MAYPKTYRYTKEHEWINVEGRASQRSESLITHNMNSADVVFVELPKPGAKNRNGERPLVTVESVKACQRDLLRRLPAK